MKKNTNKKRSTTKTKKKLNFWLVFVIIVSFISLSLYMGYRSLVVTPSINLADGLDPEEAAFLQKSISKDKTTSTGAAPAPVVKVTVKDKDTGEEYTGKVLLKNIDKPDKVSVEDLTAAITKTVVENNTPVKPSPVADPASLPPLPPTGQSCSTVASGQWAQTGIKYQADGITTCKTGEACEGLRECVQCIGGTYDLTNKQVCGQGDATAYITRPEEGKNAPCWEGGVQYADSSSFAGRGKCQNGKWVDVVVPTATPISDDLEQVELDYLAEAIIEDQLHTTPSLAPVSNPSTQTPNIPDPQSPDDRSSVSAPALSSDTGYYSSRTNCEQGIDNTKEQCNVLPGGGYGRVPLVVVVEPSLNPFNFGSDNSSGTPADLAVGDTCSYGFFGIGETCSQCPGGESHVEKTAAFQARRVCGEEQTQTTPQIISNNDAPDESTPSCGFFDRNSCGEGSTCEFNWAGINSKWECIQTSSIGVASPIISTPSAPAIVESSEEIMCENTNGIWNPTTTICTIPTLAPQIFSAPVAVSSQEPGPIVLSQDIDLDDPSNDGVLGENTAKIAEIVGKCQKSGAEVGEALRNCFCNSIDCSQGSSGAQIAAYIQKFSVGELGLECLEFTTIVITAIGDGSSPICQTEQAKGVNKSCLPTGTEGNGWYYCESPSVLYADDIGVFKGSGAENDPGHIGICAEGTGGVTCPFADMNFRNGNLALIHPVAAEELTAIYRKLPDGDPKAKGCWSTQSVYID